MTAFDQFDPFERRIATAIDEIAIARQPDYLDDVFQQTARSSQRPRWTFPERWISVNRRTFQAAAAIAVLVVAVGTYFAVGGEGPGTTEPTPSPSPSPTTSTSPTAEAVVPLPQAMWGDWHAEVDSLSGVTSQAQPIRLAIKWDDGRGLWVQLDDEGRQVLQSTPLEAQAGEIRVRADAEQFTCDAGQEGRYLWDRSADGRFLTLELIDDPCEYRANALARTWVHSLSAVTDGGLGIIPNDPWIQVALPNERFGMGGGTEASDIHDMDGIEPVRALIAVKDPMGFRAPCETDRQPYALEPDIQAFSDYLRNLPGMQLVESETTIDGLAAKTFDVSIQTEFTCTTSEPGIFRSKVPTEDAEWRYGPGDSWFLMTLVKDGSLYIFTWEGGPKEEAQAIFESLKFLETLPTP